MYLDNCNSSQKRIFNSRTGRQNQNINYTCFDENSFWCESNVGMIVGTYKKYWYDSIFWSIIISNVDVMGKG